MTNLFCCRIWFSLSILFGIVATILFEPSVANLALANAAEPSTQDIHIPWEIRLQLLKQHHTELLSFLKKSREVLLARVEVENPAFAKRLYFHPLSKSGYGVLPKIEENAPLAAVKLKKRSYSLERLTTRIDENLVGAKQLMARSSHDRNLPLEPLITEFESLRNRYQNLNKHLTYHAYWQKAIPESKAYFEKRNQIMGWVYQMEALAKQNPTSKKIEPLRNNILESLTPFTPTPGLALKTRPDGIRILPVKLVTDIENQSFLNTFRIGVEDAFVDSSAARNQRFAIELTIHKITPTVLYPQGPPAPGGSINVKTHLAQFPSSALVLTTGGESTHAWTGRAIILGPAPLSRRTLAHEFGHILGFNDVYLRGYDGKWENPYGIVIIEWRGLVNNLMGSPGSGRMTDPMIRTLIDAYSPQ